MQAVRGRIRSGGDASGGLSGPPPSQKPVALFSGLVTVGNDGNAQITFELPAFDGTLRFMAVAWNGDQLGHAVKDVIVRDKIVLIGTAPRFLSSGDSSHLHLSFDNVDGPAGSYTLEIASDGPVTVPEADAEQIFELKSKQRMDIAIPLAAKGNGSAEIKVQLTGPNNFELARTYTLPIHPAEPNVIRHFVQSLPENGGTLTLSKDLVANLDMKSAKVAVNVGQSRVLDVPGLLLALDRYPYGCAEQTTSRALPLLYLSSVAESAGLAGEKGAKMRVQKAIERLRGMQNGSGGFGFWSPSGQDLWLTAYVADFLTRAREQGYEVPQTLDQALNRLRNFVNYVPDFASGGEAVAYALYVLARNGRAGIGDLRYYADTKLKNFATPLARAQLGAALALYGDKTRAETVFRSAVSALEQADTDGSRRDYGSPLRDGAAALTLVSETSFGQSTVKSLSNVIDRLSEKRAFTSTQENAWLLLAANALQQHESALSFSMNGKAMQGTFRKILTASELSEGTFVIRNNNSSAMTATVTVSGAALSPEPAISKGFRLSRSIYTLDGKPASLETVKQNQRFVVVLKVEEMETKPGRLLLADRLPAGFEIENPRLVDSASLKAFTWLKSRIRPEHTEFRDDKFIAAFDLSRRVAKQPPARLHAAYMIRAVSPGTYLHPAAKVEDMYRPGRFARTAAGQSKIIASNR
ncbi:putative lipoprotein YfhM [bacterium MnTg02]|nr:putative lipoprotein YfhM [bacterium MnTg02]